MAVNRCSQRRSDSRKAEMINSVSVQQQVPMDAEISSVGSDYVENFLGWKGSSERPA